MSAFQRLLDEVRTDAATLSVGQASERQLLTAEHLLEDADNLEPMGAQLPISDKAIDLVVTFEVSSKAAYERAYRHPTWPKGKSGITIGIGYDIGYVSPDTLAQDWRANLPDREVDILRPACGVKGPAAQALLPQTSAVDVPFDNAMSVFRDVTLGKTATQTLRFLPRAARLHPDSFGALVSLVYNRGASFALEGDRYAEMRQIRSDIAESRFQDVPGRIRSMKRLWQNDPSARGLVTRRELEALLFEEGLAAEAATRGAT